MLPDTKAERANNRPAAVLRYMGTQEHVSYPLPFLLSRYSSFLWEGSLVSVLELHGIASIARLQVEDWSVVWESIGTRAPRGN